MTRVVVLGTGGTIGSRFSDEHGAVIAGVGGDELLRNLGHFASTVDVVTEQFCNLGSFLFTLELAFGIAKRADQLLRDSGVAGVVATCGTDTMEEIAYLSDLIVISDKPIVFTGAQRHSGLPDSDGPRDLHNAILVAASNARKDWAPSSSLRTRSTRLETRRRCILRGLAPLRRPNTENLVKSMMEL